VKILALICTGLLTLQSFSQTFSVKGGLALATYSAAVKREANPNVPRTIISTSFRTGFTLGGNVDFRLAEKLFLRTGAEMVIKGAEEEGIYTFNGTSSPYQARNKFVGFDFPVQLLYKTKGSGAPRWVLGGGFVPGLLIEGGLELADLGLGAVFGYELPGGLNANIAYNHGVANVASTSYDYKSLKNRHLAFTIGYSFKEKNITERSEFKRTREQTIVVSKPARAFYAELGGAGGLLSFNYDTRLTKSYKGVGIRAGFGLIFDAYNLGYTIPVALNYLLGDKAHFFELAAGTSFHHFKINNQDSWFGFPKTNFLAPFAWIGYRYQPVERKFVFRAGFTHLFGERMPEYARLPYPALSFGYSIR
jgi:hypothetical protein